MKKIKLAKEFCVEKHIGQKRKFNGANYSVHPMGVYIIAKQITIDEDTLVACLLHDVVEDTDVTTEEIGIKFGVEVQSIVNAVTHTLGSSWIDTRLNYLKTLENGPKKAHMVALADKIQNTQSLIDAFEQGYDVKKLFPNFERLEWFNKSVMLISGKNDLSDKLKYVTKELSKFY